MKNWTGERLETFILTRDAIEHLHRYAIVSDYITNKVVLDIACGEGYGSNLMSKDASFVYGVDIDDDTIGKAKLKYNEENLEFRVGSADKIPLESNSVDVVVSFETLEHHDKHEEMMLEVKRVLRKDGILIISTPDKLHYSDDRNFNNKFHIKELYKNDFKELVLRHFHKMQLLTQVYCGGISSIQDESNQMEVNVFSGNYSTIKNEFIKPLYLIIIASDTNFVEQKKTIFNGDKIHEIDIISKMRNSNSYKLGHFILIPFKALKRRFK
ncbi:class I SAM-dependent methyltransferase [Flavobacterium ustbae]|uniref:class I SAM-dependent methyltransferase n=1 Tax=Flavobacterium ustbae TaxID=2488790 RepID=UPI000F79B9D8|nr:class I SAM-dependent methyltransferase [Flavobacterium ustbae]